MESPTVLEPMETCTLSQETAMHHISGVPGVAGECRGFQTLPTAVALQFRTVTLGPTQEIVFLSISCPICDTPTHPA